MNKRFQATKINVIPDPSAQVHMVRGLSATTYVCANSAGYNARMLVGKADGNVLTVLKAQGATRDDAIDALYAKLVQLHSFLNESLGS